MINLVFQLPVYRKNKIKKWMNIGRRPKPSKKSGHGYADLWSVTSYPHPKEGTSLFLASA